MAEKAGDNAQWERRLNIRTAAAAYGREDQNHSPYEPSDYAVLERLACSGHISGGDLLVDYGCGKGRVDFYMHYAVGCGTVGVEYDEGLYGEAQENLGRYVRRDARIRFVCESAENYDVGEANCFYFFNPFSLKILQSVLGRILESWYVKPRTMKLFFYYALDDWRSFLMTMDELTFVEEIDCRDLYRDDDPREKILVFQIG